MVLCVLNIQSEYSKGGNITGLSSQGSHYDYQMKKLLSIMPGVKREMFLYDKHYSVTNTNDIALLKEFLAERKIKMIC